jgi:hypothetical protein
MVSDESRFRRFIKDPKQNLKLVRDREHVLSVLKKVHCRSTGTAPRRPASATGHCAPHIAPSAR